jgi:hypothetical protein
MSEDLLNYRSRRLEACRAADKLHDVIGNLGLEDGSQLPIPGEHFKPRPSAAVLRELQNQVATLLRMVLLFNDGQISHQELRRF